MTRFIAALLVLSLTGTPSNCWTAPPNLQTRRKATFLSETNYNEEKDRHDHPSLRQMNTTAAVEKKIRVAKAQAEIDRILKAPNAPLDLEAELKKVVSIAPPVPSADEAREENLAQLEEQLYKAVKSQDYRQAAQIKIEINQGHIDDCGDVLQVNAAFYKAFSRKNFEEMEAVWLKDGTSTCIHPSSRPLVGSKQVLHSWQRMFEATQGSFQKNWMEPHNIRLSIQGASTAIVSCEEHVYARRFVRGKKRQTELINKLTATNIFRKVAGKWHLCHHHASWHADSEAAKQALRAASQPSKAKIKTAPKAEKEDNEIGMDGILGINNFGPLLGDESASPGKKPVKRIVVGSLADIFNGDLSDLLNDVDNELNDEDNMDNGIDSLDLDDDDDDDDGILDDDDEGDDGSETEAVAIIKKWSESATSPSASKSNKKPIVESADSKHTNRIECVAALRRLSNQGALSPRQKRVLVTDIISCSSKGKVSMVEVAYELLCGSGDDMDVADEEFADQCRVFAHSLSEAEVRPDV